MHFCSNVNIEHYTIMHTKQKKQKKKKKDKNIN